MTKPTLTPDLIAESLDTEHVELDVQPAEGWECVVSFVHKGDGVIQATLYDAYDNDVEVEARTFPHRGGGVVIAAELGVRVSDCAREGWVR